jgi:hypothetical protein
MCVTGILMSQPWAERDSERTAAVVATAKDVVNASPPTESTT